MTCCIERQVSLQGSQVAPSFKLVRESEVPQISNFAHECVGYVRCCPSEAGKQDRLSAFLVARMAWPVQSGCATGLPSMRHRIFEWLGSHCKAAAGQDFGAARAAYVARWCRDSLAKLAKLPGGNPDAEKHLVASE